MKKGDKVVITDGNVVIASNVVLSQKSKIWINFLGLSIPFSRETEECLRKEVYLFAVVSEDKWRAIDRAYTEKVLKEAVISAKVVKDLFNAFEIPKSNPVYKKLASYA